MLSISFFYPCLLRAINPTLQLAKILTQHGAQVTFATTTSGLNPLPTIDGLFCTTIFDDEQISNESKDVDSNVVADAFSALKRLGPRKCSGKHFRCPRKRCYVLVSYFPDIKVFPVGPLLPAAIFNKHDKSLGGNMARCSTDNYLNWMDSKPDKSVVYVSFGSIMVLKESEKEEILRGLRDSKRPFLWVIREIKDEEREKYCVSEEIGFIVPWCSQLEVLSHPATGCFVSHCGWNSTLESIASGIPVVGCPTFLEQDTNMKMIEEFFGTGISTKK